MNSDLEDWLPEDEHDYTESDNDVQEYLKYRMDDYQDVYI